MAKEYLDKNGNPLREGFYKAGNILLQIRYISRDVKGGWKCEFPDGDISKLEPDLFKHNLVPLSDTDAGPLSYELSQKANFIKSKLEQLAQSENKLSLSKVNPVAGLSLKRYPIRG